MNMFNCHIKNVSLLRSKSDLFIQIFLNDATLISQQLGLILQTLEDQCLGIDGLRAAICKILDLGVGIETILKLELKGSKTEELFI